MTSLKNILIKAAHQLAKSQIPKLDAEILLSFTLNIPRSYLYAHPEETINSKKIVIFEDLLKRRLQGEPIAYITGHQEFWSMDLLVSSDVLIPRPETEILIETAIALFSSEEHCHVLDLGSGSGAIALAIAKERTCWDVMGVDRSEKAVVIAKNNQQRLQIFNVDFLKSDWFAAISEERLFNLIVSNPPYIPQNDPHLKQGDVRFEPKESLISGVDGLDAVRFIAANAARYLKSSGYLIFEHGYDQKASVKSILQQNHFVSIQSKKDLAGKDRVTLGKKSDCG